MAIRGERIGTAYIKVIADGSGLPKSIVDDLQSADPEVREAGERHAQEYNEGFARNLEASDKLMETYEKYQRETGKNTIKTREWRRELERNHLLMPMLIHDIDNIGNSLGRTFGRGSRNNLLNAFGGTIGGVTNLITGAADGMVSAFGRLRDVWSSSAKFGTKLGTSVADLAPVLIQGSIAIGIFVAALIPLSILLSSVAGIIAALASSLIYALIGSLTPLVGLLGPLAFAIGAVATAFIGMDKAAKKALKESFKPIKEALKDLGDAARPGILDGLTKGFKNLKPVLNDMEPIFRRFGRAIGDNFEDLTEELNKAGGGFRDLMGVMERQGPSIIRRLGTSFNNALGGISGIFAELNRKGGPVDNFMNWLVEITEKFDEWASSPKGQKEMREFFEDAEESANDLWTALDKVWGLLTTIIEGGKGSGDNMITSLGDAAEDLDNWIKENPDDLEEWFNDAKDTAEELGKTIEQLILLMDELDSDENRGGLQLSLGGVGVALEYINWFTKQHWIPNLNSVLYWFDRIRTSAGRIKLAIDIAGVYIRVRKALTGLAGFFSRWVGRWALDRAIEVGGVVAKVRGALFGLAGRFGSWVGTWAADKALDVTGMVDKISGKLAGLASRFAGWIGDFDVSKVFDVTGIWDKIMDAIPTAADILTHIGSTVLNFAVHIDWPDPPGWLSKVTASGGIFSGAQTRIIGEAGPEAVVPLNRPLAMVDPAVRELSAYAQGLTVPSTNTASEGKRVDVGGITIITPTKDPVAVAQETVNQMTASAYF